MGDRDDLATARVVRLPRRLEAAPRSVPRTMWLALCFGGPFGSFGWLIAAAGFALCAAVVPEKPPAYDRTAPAVITTVAAVHGSKGSTHYDLSYTFSDEAGAHHAGVVSVRHRTDEPARPVAKYVAASPDESALEYLDPVPIGPAIWLLLLAPLFGLAIALPVWITGARAYGLLRRGIETRGTLVKRGSGLKIDHEPTAWLTFEYTTGGGAVHQTLVKTRNAAPLLDEPTEAMLYDPARPERATPLDHLPGRPRIVDGKLTASRSWGLACAILPLAALAGLVAMIARLAAH